MLWLHAVLVSMYLLLGVALLYEGRPNGSGGNCIHPNASFNEMCCQALGECRNGTLHLKMHIQQDVLDLSARLPPLSLRT